MDQHKIAGRGLSGSGGLLIQFSALASVVLLVGMIGLGIWVNDQIKRIVIANAGATTALYVDSMVTPTVQGMADSPDLQAEAAAKLTTVLKQGALSRAISAFKLWDTTGRIVYSDRAELVGRAVPENPRLAVALTGEVYAELREVTDPPQTILMEVYSPVRSNLTGEIIAVAEFYTTTQQLQADLWRSVVRTWVVMGTVTLAMFLILSTVVARGSRTIARQIAELSDLLGKNADLRRGMEQVNRRIAESNEQHLRRLSAELHDGPAQHLAFAALRLDGAKGHEAVAEAVGEALQELRLICRGLVLPELETWSVPDIARRLIATHEERTGIRPVLTTAPILPDLPAESKNCVYRFLQEALNNSARHAAGAALSIKIATVDDGLSIEVRDQGPGFDPAAETSGLGLIGLRDRILGHKGRFSLNARIAEGTCVSMWLPGPHEGRTA